MEDGRGRRLSTLSWIHWHNRDCLDGYLADVPPAESKKFYATKRTTSPWSESNSQSLHQTRAIHPERPVREWALWAIETKERDAL